MHSKILKGMRDYFLGKKEVNDVIGERLYDVIAPERIKTLQNPNSGPYSPRTGRFCEYRQVGAIIDRLVGGASKLRRVMIEFTWSAQTPALAREAWEAVFDLWGNDLYNGTWNTLEVSAVHWDLDSETNGFDDVMLMATHSVTLVLQYRSA
jgi:hypothetical protein